MGTYINLKKKVYRTIGTDKEKTITAKIFDVSLCVLVLLSCIAVILELFVNLPSNAINTLRTFEYITVGIFILEYLLRLWVCEFEFPECENKLSAIWEFLTSFESLIDIISILSVLFNGIPKEFAILRLVKLIKLVRLVKLSDYIETSGRFNDLMKRAQKRTNEIIDKDVGHDVVSKVFDITSVILIMLSVSFVIVETFPIPWVLLHALHIFEIVIAIFFTIEYVLRIWTAPLDYPALRPDKARMKYIFSFMSLIDLLSIVPVFVSGMSTATGILKIFKLCKILRLLKASRYLNSIANFGKAIQKKKRQILMSVIAITVIIIICSMLLYAVESKEQPDVFKNGFSGVYYSILTMADADADIAPVTPIGRAISTIMLLLGGCLLGVPVAIVATGFEDMIAEQAGDPANGDIYEVLRRYDELDDKDKQRFMTLITTQGGEELDS